MSKFPDSFSGVVPVCKLRGCGQKASAGANTVSKVAKTTNEDLENMAREVNED